MYWKINKSQMSKTIHNVYVTFNPSYFSEAQI